MLYAAPRNVRMPMAFPRRDDVLTAYSAPITITFGLSEGSASPSAEPAAPSSIARSGTASVPAPQAAAVIKAVGRD
jgi:hypothetical protein